VKNDLAGGARHARSLSCAGHLSEHGLAVARGHYVERLGQLLQRTPSRRLAVRRFHQHLMVEFEAIFSFLFDPTLDATNWRAEHALRPAVVTRKMCGGGNRTRRDGDSQHILASVLRTADQRGLDTTEVLVALLTAPIPRCRRASRRSPRYTDPLNTDLPTANAELRVLGRWQLKIGSGWSLGFGRWEFG